RAAGDSNLEALQLRVLGETGPERRLLGRDRLLLPSLRRELRRRAVDLLDGRLHERDLLAAVDRDPKPVEGDRELPLDARSDDRLDVSEGRVERGGPVVRLFLRSRVLGDADLTPDRAAGLLHDRGEERGLGVVAPGGEELSVQDLTDRLPVRVVA